MTHPGLTMYSRKSTLETKNERKQLLPRPSVFRPNAFGKCLASASLLPTRIMPFCSHFKRLAGCFWRIFSSFLAMKINSTVMKKGRQRWLGLFFAKENLLHLAAIDELDVLEKSQADFWFMSISKGFMSSFFLSQGWNGALMLLLVGGWRRSFQPCWYSWSSKARMYQRALAYSFY